ncbi:MAG: DUF4129 domain-containing protein [Pirellulales bacterium]
MTAIAHSPYCRAAMAHGTSRCAAIALALAALFTCALLTNGSTAVAADDTELVEVPPPIESGREALRKGVDPPWYDAPTDSVRPMPLPEERGIRLAQSELITRLLTWLAWIVLALILGVLVFLLIRAYLARDAAAVNGPVTAGGEQSIASRTSALPFKIDQAPTDFLAAARDCYQRGEYGRAIIFFYSHLLLELDRHQFLRLARGKTNRQYVRELTDRPRLAGLLEPTMLLFEATFFGGRPATRDQLDRCWERLDELNAIVREAAR